MVIGWGRGKVFIGVRDKRSSSPSTFTYKSYPVMKRIRNLLLLGGTLYVAIHYFGLDITKVIALAVKAIL